MQLSFKMVTLLEKCTLEEHRAVVRFFIGKKHVPAKHIHKEIACL